MSKKQTPQKLEGEPTCCDTKRQDCPHCGRCPTCGRGGYRPWNPYPYPYWYDYPGTWTYHDNSTGDVTVRFS